MKYDHVVKHNGITYPAGTDVPNGKKPELTNDVPTGALDNNPDGSVNVYDENGNAAGTIDAETVAQVQEEAGKQWTKTEINRMAVEDLRKLATENGIEKVEEISGADLKKVLIEKLGL